MVHFLFVLIICDHAGPVDLSAPSNHSGARVLLAKVPSLVFRIRLGVAVRVSRELTDSIDLAGLSAVFPRDSISAHLGGAFSSVMAWFSTTVTGLAGVVDPGGILVPSVLLVLGIQLVTGVPIPSVALLKAGY